MNRPDKIADVWRIGEDLTLPLNEPRLMGIINPTPDSFSNGGMFKSVDAMIGYALRLIEEGACIIDVGGESTRPGATRVGAEKQIERTAKFIEQLHACSDAVISIDTTLAAVAEAALDAGASIINDVSAGLEDEGILKLAADRGCGLVLMHRLAPPDEDSFSDQYEQEPHYEDVTGEVLQFLLERCEAAEQAGVSSEAIVIDPGLGFGKTVEQNFELIRRTEELVGGGYPVLSGGSRKSFIGAVTGIKVPHDRVIGSTAVSVAQYRGGARLFRVHDPAAHREALDVTAAVEGASKLMASSP